jgi:hypothetical protein
VSLDGLRVTAARATGGLGSPPPERVRITRSGGPSPANGAWRGVEHGRAWASGDETEVAFDQGECDGWWEVELDMALEQSCGQFDPVEVCFDLENTMARRELDERASCEPGEAVFQLIPWDRYDRDGNGRRALVFWPMQLYGTGTLTNDAWITEVRALHSGASLRMVYSDLLVSFVERHRLVDAEQLSMPLNTLSSAVPIGLLTGSSPVVGLGVPTESPLLQVKLGWECSSDGDQTGRGHRFRGESYVADLDAMGCGVRQKLTLTPREDLLAFLRPSSTRTGRCSCAGRSGRGAPGWRSWTSRR